MKWICGWHKYATVHDKNKQRSLTFPQYFQFATDNFEADCINDKATGCLHAGIMRINR